MTLEDRVEALERAVAELSATPRPVGAPGVGDLWVVDGVREQVPEGAVVYGGALEVPGGGPVRWQYGMTLDQALDADWSEVAPALDALGNPVRLRLLQRVFSGVRTTAELAADDDLGTTGQVHHHLRILVAAGWLTQRARGTYEIPGPRVVPLLVALLAARPA